MAIPIYGDAIEPILHFSLLWNLFERDACGKQASRTRIRTVVASAAASNRVTAQFFAEHLDYLRDHVQRNGMTIDRYLDALKVHERDRPLVGQVLQGQLNDDESIVHALLLVVLRIRNNLFHGEKDVANLHTQSELFRAANSIIATYLTVTEGAA